MFHCMTVIVFFRTLLGNHLELRKRLFVVSTVRCTQQIKGSFRSLERLIMFFYCTLVADNVLPQGFLVGFP